MSDKIMEPLNLNPGSGMLFKRAKKSDKQPDYVGEIEIPEGMQGRKEISLWKRTAKSGKVYLSVKVGDPWKPTQKTAPPRQSQRVAPQADPDFDDDLPF